MKDEMEELTRPVLQPFLDSDTSFEEARYVLFGAPLDTTASHRSGSRFAPDAIRRASLHMETLSPHTGLDQSDVSIADLGNLINLDPLEEALGSVEEVVRRVRDAGKTPVMMGGEHTVTLGGLRALRPDLVVDFDAHLDLRDELLGERLSHGTFMRRALEELDFKLLLVGCRALSREELEFAEENSKRVALILAGDLLRGGVETGADAIRDWLEEASSVYLSVDMDVVDPAQAPAVGDPSPEGLGVTDILDLIETCAAGQIQGLDLTEITPHYDSGLTVTQAAYILLESVYYLDIARR
ncbi:MAG: agmatinase [Candidatus Bathyarchaeota archaeon]|nr:MAG: agmatinase [Candidatus Bathyarchaeota archaeon]